MTSALAVVAQVAQAVLSIPNFRLIKWKKLTHLWCILMRLGVISSFCACNLSKNVNVIYLPTKHQGALGARSKVSVPSRSNWNLVLVFVEG